VAVTEARRTASDAMVQESTPSLPELQDREREREWAKPEPCRPVIGNAMVGDETASDKPKTHHIGTVTSLIHLLHSTHVT